MDKNSDVNNDARGNNKKGKKKLSKSKLKQMKNKPTTDADGLGGENKKEADVPVELNLSSNVTKTNVKDIHVPNYTLGRPGGGPELLSGTDIQLTFGRKYGLIGKNGFGKTTLLSNIASHKIPEIPNNLHILHIKQDLPSNELSVIDTVVEADLERLSLLKEEKRLSAQADGERDEDRLRNVQMRLLAVEAASARNRAAVILRGLEFTEAMQRESTNSLSGGWRMKVSLACALFAEPDLLLLDEPTNHLDFPAVEWLKNYILNYEKTLVIVSHDRKFLNDVCTDIIHIEDRKLKYYRGDYDTFERVRDEQRKQAKTAYDKQQESIEHIQDFIRRFRANKKLASLAQSRIKILDNMVRLEDVKEDSKFRFSFPTPDALKKNELLLLDEMAFGYDAAAPLYRGVNLRLEMKNVVGVFGRNGTGKSTLISLVLGTLRPLAGAVELNQSCSVGYFAQHHSETLELDLTPYELLIKKFPTTKHQEIYRKLGQFRLSDNCAEKQIRLLSGGEKSRLSFAILTWHNPHLLVMDEPTNHLDLDTIDGLIEAIKNFDGGVILISHDEHFLTSVCKEFWAIGQNKEMRAFHSFEDGKEFSYMR